jgi:aspartate-semialdehyde dehydrogenase
MSRSFKLAVVGATGAVGRQLLEILDERDFPVGELCLLGSEESDGEFLEFRNEEYLVQQLSDEAFVGTHIVLFCATPACTRQFAPLAAAAGAVCIDCSGAFNGDTEVPLVIPEVNPEAVGSYRNRGVIANPGSAVIPLVMALAPLHAESPIRRLEVSTYQAVSAWGQKGIDELRLQCGELLNGRPCDSKVFPHQIAFNCLPAIGAFQDNGYSSEEMSLINETRRILGDESIRISATAVQVPVFFGHSEAVSLETTVAIPLERAKELLAAAPGIDLVDDLADGLYPLPIEAAGQDQVLVGRLRTHIASPDGLNLWLAADNLRKGVATNAVQIAELLIERYL